MTFRRWAILGIALVCVGGNLLYFEGRPATPAADAGVDAAKESCASLVERYAREAESAARCSVDADCLAEKHDEVLSGLGDCIRVRNADAGMSGLTEIEGTWKASGCAKQFVSCAPNGVRCVAGTCRALPPAGVPADWVRFEHVSHVTKQVAFALWLPPGSKPLDYVGDDGEGGAFDTPHFKLDYEFDEYAPLLDPNVDAGDTSLGARDEAVSGVQGHFRSYRMPNGKIMFGVRFDPIDSVARIRPNLSLFAWCTTAEECAEVWTIGRSVQFR